MATNDHVTKADLTAGLKGLRDELKADISGLRSEFKTDMSALKDALSEAIHDTETKLLTAFYGFMESNEKATSKTRELRTASASALPPSSTA